MTQAEDPALDALRATLLGARFPAHLRESELLQPGTAVLVAVSGGLDSVTLLHLLRFLTRDWQLRLVVAHYDHRMRAASAADGDWVAGVCRAWGLPLERGRASQPLRSESRAREARYRFLHSAADRCGAERIATAHHADDQAETVLFRMIRGTGVRGLAGIPERRGAIVRPLLPFRRADIAAYARAVQLRHREDPTNRLLTYARNRLRHEALPLLEQIQPGAAAALVRLAAQARAAEDAWDRVLDQLASEVILARRVDVLELARPRLVSYHPQVRARLLRRLLRRLGISPTQAGTRAALEFISFGASGGGIQVAGGISIEREFDRVRLRRGPSHMTPPSDDRPLVIQEGGRGEGKVVTGGRRLAVRWSGATCGAGGEGAVFDAQTLKFPLELRRWRPGDRIRLSYGTKKLKKLFVERRVGRAERARTPVLAEVDGQVLWVAGIARAYGTEPVAGRPVFRISVRDAGARDAGEG